MNPRIALSAAHAAALGDAPLAQEVDDHLVSLAGSDTAEFQQYLVLRQAIERAHDATGLSVVGVTSAGVGDGKTTTAVNLAGAIAADRRTRVLLVDADLRLPSVEARLGMTVRTGAGLTEALQEAGPAGLDAVYHRSPFNLSVLGAGHLGKENPYELLRSPRFAALIAEARRQYDYVIVDAPPVVPIPDCRLMELVVDAFLLVVAAHRTPRRLLSEALNALSPDKTLGIVFNGADFPLRGYYRSYYGYGRPAAQTRAPLWRRLLRSSE